MRSIFKTSLPLKTVLKSFRFFSFSQLFIFMGGSDEVVGPPQQHLECLNGSHSEWRRSHSSAGQWERRTLSKQKGQNWDLDSVPVTSWPSGSSSPNTLAARLINNTPRVVALSRNEAWRSAGSATTRGVLFISRLSYLYSKNIKNIEKLQILSDNGPILTLASSARWSGTFSNFFGPPGEGPCSGTPSRKLTYRKRWKKMRFWKWAYRIGWKFACF